VGDQTLEFPPSRGRRQIATASRDRLMAATYPAYIEWPELRRAVLAGGGIGPSPDWPRDWYPADLFRRHGKAPDLIAAETVLGYADLPPWGGDGGDAAMFSYLQSSYAEWERYLAQRPRRETRNADVYELAHEHGLSLRSVWNVARDASLQARKGPIPRRTYFGAQVFAQALAAAPRMPRVKRARIVERLAA
jgi:hypothetical protein